MGTFRQKIGLARVNIKTFEYIDAVVDTGATYTWIAKDILEKLSIVPQFKRKLKLADGKIIERDLAQVQIKINGEAMFTPCIFGDLNSEPLLGAVTLEEFGLGVDPINKRLIPVPAFLLEVI